MSYRSLFLALPLIVACGTHQAPGPTPPGPVADAAITLSEGACFGTCPIYSITVYPTEFYELDAGQFTASPGMSTGSLPAGSWAAARGALIAADFDALPTDITPANPAACGTTIVSDLPPATVSETTIAGTKTVQWNRGCFDAPDRAALTQLVADLRSALTVDALVTP